MINSKTLSQLILSTVGLLLSPMTAFAASPTEDLAFARDRLVVGLQLDLEDPALRRKALEEVQSGLSVVRLHRESLDLAGDIVLPVEEGLCALEAGLLGDRATALVHIAKAKPLTDRTLPASSETIGARLRKIAYEIPVQRQPWCSAGPCRTATLAALGVGAVATVTGIVLLVASGQTAATRRAEADAGQLTAPRDQALTSQSGAFQSAGVPLIPIGAVVSLGAGLVLWLMSEPG